MICVEHISKSYGQVQALRDVSLTVNRGELYGLIKILPIDEQVFLLYFFPCPLLSVLSYKHKQHHVFQSTFSKQELKNPAYP